jgi:hypothetical protein
MLALLKVDTGEMHKKYLVAKVSEHHDLVPLAGLFPLETAERFLAQLRQAKPDESFVIQEVGSA